MNKVKKNLRKLWKKISMAVDPVEREFKSVYGCIDKVPGFLKSPMQERWFFKTALEASNDAVIVEIGSFKGRSTVSFGFGCRNTKRHIYAIDLFEGDGADYGSGEFENAFIANIEMCKLSQYVTPIKKHSMEVAETWSLPIDVLFIDGSHEYEDVKADFNAFYPFVKKDGVIAFHDIKGKWDGVIRFWGEVQEPYLYDVGTVSSLGYGRKR